METILNLAMHRPYISTDRNRFDKRNYVVSGAYEGRNYWGGGGLVM